MVSTQHTQSLTDFRQKATETLDRLRKTGEAEVLTVNGEARAVLMSPEAYDELAREALAARDIEVMRQAIKEHRAGEADDADVFFARLRAETLAMKSRPAKKASR